MFSKREKIKGTCKVHGGGFTGTILSIVENSSVEEYKTLMKKVFGENAVTQAYVRNANGLVY